MKLAIIGTSSFESKADELKAKSCTLAMVEACAIDTEIISGAATGVDSWAAAAARARGMAVDENPADWASYGNYWAGRIRNSKVLFKADEVIAIWDGHSPGTKDMITKCGAAKKRLTIIYFKDFSIITPSDREWQT